MRFLILLILMYVGYRMFRAWMLPQKPTTKPEEPGEVALVDDVMVKDPFCETYLPKRNGIKKVVGGETHYFCSTGCRDKYLERSNEQ